MLGNFGDERQIKVYRVQFSLKYFADLLIIPRLGQEVSKPRPQFQKEFPGMNGFDRIDVTSTN